MKTTKASISIIVALAAVTILFACGGGGGGGGGTGNLPVITYSIMGIVSGAPQGTTVTLSGSAASTTTTNSIGYYQFTGLSSSGSYTVTASFPGYTFSPATKSVTISSANATNQDFTVIDTYGIAGTVKSGGVGVSGVTITLVNSAGVATTTTTDANGVYSAVGLAAGTYTVSASKTDYAFNPLNQKATVMCDMKTGVAFIATAALNTYSITGTVTSGVNPVPGATLTLSNANSGIVHSSVSGTYAFTGLINGSYTVTASKTGSVFSLACNITIINVDPSPCNFTVTGPGPSYMPPPACVDLSGTISGTISSGVTVTVNYFHTQSSSQTMTTTDGSGNYLVSIPSSTYVITPSTLGYTFSPLRICGTPTPCGTITGNNFTSQ